MSLGVDDVNGREQPPSGAGGSHQGRGGELPKSLTGILRGLDEITRGGLPTGRPTLVCGGPGSGKTLLALTFLVNGALQQVGNRHRRGLYMLKSRGMAHSNELCQFVMTNHGLDLLEGAAATPRVVGDVEYGSAEGGARHAVV